MTIEQTIQSQRIRTFYITKSGSLAVVKKCLLRIPTNAENTIAIGIAQTIQGAYIPGLCRSEQFLHTNITP